MQLDILSDDIIAPAGGTRDLIKFSEAGAPTVQRLQRYSAATQPRDSRHKGQSYGPALTQQAPPAVRPPVTATETDYDAFIACL